VQRLFAAERGRGPSGDDLAPSPAQAAAFLGDAISLSFRLRNR